MAQVTIYLADAIEARARAVAESSGTSLGRWIAEQVAGKISETWPPDVLSAIGSFSDFPDHSSLRAGYGIDGPRESLD